MPRYCILADHAPNICPSSNGKTRARAMEALAPDAMQRVAQAVGLTFVVDPLHLDPSHRTVAVVDAPTVEAVAQFVYETGLAQWNTVEVAPMTPVSEMMARVNDFPVVYD